MNASPPAALGGLRSLVFLLLVAALGCGEPAVVERTGEPRGPVETRATVDRAVATTGDLITYRIVVDAETNYDVEIPEAGAEIAGFRIVDIGTEEPRDSDGRIIRERWYQLRADLVGSYVLPPIEVRYRESGQSDAEAGAWQTVATSEIFVEVASVLPTDLDAEDIRGLKPLRRVKPPVPWSLIALIAGGLIAIAVLAVWYLRRKAGRQELPPPIPAHELAFRALDALRRTDFDDPEAVRRFYFRISEVLRGYVEGRYGMNATDLTTEEIVRLLAGVPGLKSEQNRQLHHFLVDTDQVKFAHREPSPVDVEATYERALSFVEATRGVAETGERVAA